MAGRLATGIEEFDRMVQGGLPLGGSVVLQGPAGAGKLRFALALLAAGLKGDSSGLVVVFSQTGQWVLNQLRELGVDLGRVIAESRLRIVDGRRYTKKTTQEGVEENRAQAPINAVQLNVGLSHAVAALRGTGPRLAVVESLSSMLDLIGLKPTIIFAQTAKRKFDRLRVTALFILDNDRHSSHELVPLHQAFDGVIETEPRGEGESFLQTIRVLSMKDTAPDSKSHVIDVEKRGIGGLESDPKAEALEAAGDEALLGSHDERVRRYRLLAEIATDRLERNAKDTEALFALAVAQGLLSEIRNALRTLERLASLDPTYPGLWALKAKLHNRVGETERARQSLRRAEQTPEVPIASTKKMAPCPVCEAPVADDETECRNCGITLVRGPTPKEQLNRFVRSAVPELTQEGPLSDAIPPRTPPRSSRGPGPRRGTAGPQVGSEKEPAKRGLTNGLVLEQARNRATGMTNGLARGQGRTKGLASGLTNGIGRTNGLATGLTNGLGRTNGLQSSRGSPSMPREAPLRRRHRRIDWRLYLLPLAAAIALLIPLLFVPDYGGSVRPIQVDGRFDDWPPSALIAQSAAPGLNAGVDVQRFGAFDNGDRLAFYVEVRGTALAGGGLPPRYDTFRLFLDIDRSDATGYSVAGLGADRLIEISGWGNNVNATILSEWDANRAPIDWNGWIKASAIRAATVGSRVELEVPWDLLAPSKRPIAVFGHFQSYDSTFDETDYVIGVPGGSLVVDVESIAPELVIGSNVPLLELRLAAYGADSAYSSITATMVGTAVPNAISALRLADSSGGVLQELVPPDREVVFQFPQRTLPAGGSESLFLRADVLGGAGETVGGTVASPGHIAAGDAFVTLRTRPALRSVGYIGIVPPDHRIDGGFSEWVNVSLDPVDGGHRPDVDLREFGFERDSSTGNLYLRVEGRVLQGLLVPAENIVAAGRPPLPGFADPDRDTVPDVDDPMPYDFNNDGTDDAATNGDYDGDGVTDYPFGPDWYLNTTIPSTFPPTHANRPVSLYIGPTIRPPLFGEDVARVFIDADRDTLTGFRINVLGADYLAEFRGRSGILTYRTLSEFSGSYPLEWSWNSILSMAAVTDYARLEASFPTAGLVLGNQSLAYFEVMDWNLDKDASLDPILRIGGRSGASPTPSYSPGTVRTLDLSSNQKWFFTNANSAETVCTSNKDATTTAGAAAASTTLSQGQTICWYSPDAVPDTISGVWEVILDIDKASDATQAFSPNANGGTNSWTVDGTGCTDEANEWQCVDETPNDGDSSYIASTASTPTDSLFNIPDWATPPSPLSIVNVVVEASCRRNVGGAVDARIVIRSGTTTAAGGTSPNCPNSATYVLWSDSWTTDPDDGAAWTLADINALQVGVRDNDSGPRAVRVSHVRAIVSFVPVYSVEINRCNNADCTSITNLYPATNFNSYGADVTIQTGTIAAQTLVGQEHIQWKIKLETAGTVTIRYNGPYPGTDDTRGTVAFPEFEEVVIPIAGSLIVVAVARRLRLAKSKRESP